MTTNKPNIGDTVRITKAFEDPTRDPIAVGAVGDVLGLPDEKDPSTFVQIHHHPELDGKVYAVPPDCFEVVTTFARRDGAPGVNPQHHTQMGGIGNPDKIAPAKPQLPIDADYPELALAPTPALVCEIVMFSAWQSRGPDFVIPEAKKAAYARAAAVTSALAQRFWLGYIANGPGGVTV